MQKPQDHRGIACYSKQCVQILEITAPLLCSQISIFWIPSTPSSPSHLCLRYNSVVAYVLSHSFLPLSCVVPCWKLLIVRVVSIQGATKTVDFRCSAASVEDMNLSTTKFVTWTLPTLCGFPSVRFGVNVTAELVVLCWIVVGLTALAH
jgi:hypothetical protein